ncbi:hypothetical protein FisN_2Hh339 [Fistulifera solaris]|uniref:Phospholipid:diacylglycerol acyltransferase n=1 Tax=Fistulifera solaris TaxID=1519565 RepID=A0A1Z5KK66_FISSO|nr:hypothetical protein FisN_2Hh339 [Fistulifera solaris]|eukprot:GAX26714.1 hypothetical protein FisN_2Hh339 [Fistulifera solaris]
MPLTQRWTAATILSLKYVVLFLFLHRAHSDDDIHVATTHLTETLLSDFVTDKLSLDAFEDSFLDPIQADPDCEDQNCYTPPVTTLEEGDAEDTCSTDFQTDVEEICTANPPVDKHWGRNPNILRMRDKLRRSGSGLAGEHNTTRPPIFLIPGLAATRLIAWKFKACPGILSDIKIQDNVWLNLQILVQASTLDVSCMKECIALGVNQSDANDSGGCKLRPDEGLDAISSLSPDGFSSEMLMGGTNTVYAWLIQWLAEHLGYDVSNLIGLPYDWRLTPSKMQERDGYLANMRRKLEASVSTSQLPGIVVAHSMGNLVFQYFLEWLRAEFRQEAFEGFLKRAAKRERARQDRLKKTKTNSASTSYLSTMSGWLYSEPQATDAENDEKPDEQDRTLQLRELAKIEGDALWHEWIEKHIWTYVGLAAPLLGAANPLRAVISGENMGMPLTDEAARHMELSFGSTHTLNPVSTKMGFCDSWDFEKWDEKKMERKHVDVRLACLDDIVLDIESQENKDIGDPWANFPTLKNLLYKRSDWDSDIPMIQIVEENCTAKEKSPCAVNRTLHVGPRDVQSGRVFEIFNEIWNEPDEPLLVKRNQLKDSFWRDNVKNMLNRTWERPLIKHVIMAYGVDIPTEVGYAYRKRNEERKSSSNEIPNLETVYWETEGGRIEEERVQEGGFLLLKKKPTKRFWKEGHQKHGGDGSVPYLSLAWAQTWLLHSVRALKHSGEEFASNPLDHIRISRRPKGAIEWKEGVEAEAVNDEVQKDLSDTGTSHPHGTKYKPEMIRYFSNGTSRTTGIEYTTSVIEAIGVEHKETTRNYDILAAVFTDVLQFMHDDFDLI